MCESSELTHVVKECWLNQGGSVLVHMGDHMGPYCR